MRGALMAVGLLAASLGCAAEVPRVPVPVPSVTTPVTTPASSPSPRPTTSASGRPSPSTSPTSTAAPSRAPTPRVNTAAVLRDIRHLASDIGPREATSRNFAEAADFVEARLERLGYRVRRTSVRVPAGNSWGTPVGAGRSANVIAQPPGFDDRKPHVVIGAHLDTVPVAPGAEDNASGVAVLLELARLASVSRLDVPVQFIAFGAEEPRGTGDALHHFGSQQYVATLSRAERRSIVGMVALDRVGVRADFVPVCRATDAGGGLQAAVRAAARRISVPTRGCQNTTSDHWSYAKAGVPGIRLGSVPYAGYHSRGDVYSVVNRRQLDRVGRVMWAWLQDPR